MSRFIPTKWNTAEDKEKFLAQFKRFVESDFKRTQFPKWFYTRLSMTFGHIAHYNQEGFYATFFTSTRDKVYFLNQTLQWPCYGDPEFTYCDVEKEIQQWLQDTGKLEQVQAYFRQETENEERRTLAALKAKYEVAP